MSYSNIFKPITHRTRDILFHVSPSHWPCRRAYTSTNPYPYPTHPNPQPHQIFHLPRSATQQQIKERYYDLVRIYHPDSPVARNYPADIAQARFHSISKAYDLMRGKSTITGEVLTNRERQVDPGRFRPRAPSRPHFDNTAGDERWKERVLFGATVLAIVAFVVQTTIARHMAIVRATDGTRIASPRPKYSIADEALVEPSRPEGTRSSSSLVK